MRLDLRVKGLGNVPAEGPLLIAARHVHHLNDGVALIGTLPRPAHIVAGLDWISSAPVGIAMRTLCRAAKWPVINRADPAQAVDPAESKRLLLAATRQILDLLRAGEIVIFFPEAYPNIDPGPSRKPALDDWLPFEPGVVRIATIAARAGIPTPIVPVGFWYGGERNRTIAMRFGKSLLASTRAREASLLQDLEREVRALSQAAD